MFFLLSQKLPQYNPGILTQLISIFDLYDKKRKVSLSIFKNMGIVLSENTITSEKIAAGSIIMDVVSEKKAMNIEN